MSQDDEDKRNALIIASRLNGSQNNSIPLGMIGPTRDCWNLSDFGFACTIMECVPSRYLRIRALKWLKRVTRNIIVLEQIDKYLKDDMKWDSQIADRLAFDLQAARKKLKAGAA